MTWPAPDGSKPYYVLARELGESYRHIINYADWMEPLAQWRPSHEDAVQYMRTRPDLARRVYHVWINEMCRREGCRIQYDYLGDEL